VIGNGNCRIWPKLLDTYKCWVDVGHRVDVDIEVEEPPPHPKTAAMFNGRIHNWTNLPSARSRKHLSYRTLESIRMHYQRSLKGQKYVAAAEKSSYLRVILFAHLHRKGI
jgi:hypothetical protein